MHIAAASSLHHCRDLVCLPSRTRLRMASVPTRSSVAATRAVPPPHGIRHWLTIPFKVPASWALRIADAKSVISSPTSLWWIRDCLLSYTYSIGSSMVKLRNPPVFYKKRDCDRRNDRNDYQYDHQLRQSKSFFLCVFHLYSSFIRCFRHLCITFYYMMWVSKVPNYDAYGLFRKFTKSLWNYFSFLR